jgi:hypothetical protein
LVIDFSRKRVVILNSGRVATVNTGRTHLHPSQLNDEVAFNGQKQLATSETKIFLVEIVLIMEYE